MLDESAEEFRGEWLPSGFQERKVRRPRKKIPNWARSATALAMHVLGDEGRVRLRAGYLYWCVGMNAKEVAACMGKSQKSIRNLLFKLRRKGLPTGVSSNPL